MHQLSLPNIVEFSKNNPNVLRNILLSLVILKPYLYVNEYNDFNSINVLPMSKSETNMIRQYWLKQSFRMQKKFIKISHYW